LHDASLYFVSVGDSGLFLRRDGTLRMLNRPHVFANLLDAAVARGNLSPEDAQNHPERESLTSFIGAESLEEIDLSADPIPLAPGDTILLASDGLFKTLSPDEMLASMRGDSQSFPDKLVERAVAQKREHQDNVTVLSVAVESDQPAVVPLMTPSVSTAVPIAAVPSRRSLMPWAVLIVFALLAAGAGWWFYGHRPAVRFTATPASSDPGSNVSAPPGPRPADIKLDPDAPHAPAQKEPPK